MNKRSKTAQIAYDLSKPVAEQMGFDLVDAEFKKEGQSTFLRLFIDKKGGVGIDDCEAFSQAVDPILDQNMKRDEDYFEVSSPGLTRPLQEMSDYIRYEGEVLDVSLFADSPWGKSFTAAIAGCDGEQQKIRFVDGEGNEEEFLLQQIAKAVRHIDF